MTLTNLELTALRGILDSDFMDGAKGHEAVGKQVWTWSANPFPSKRTFSGIVASLAKKGLVASTDEGEDSVIWLTKAGVDALLALGKRQAG
jgi:hypothetical protein